MIDPNLVERIETISQQFLQAISDLQTSESFSSLLSHHDRLQADWQDVIQVGKLPRVRKREVTFSCAIVGSSNSGKTSLMMEMFPELEQRGWLVTDVSDTTSQALVIRHTESDPEKSEDVDVISWDIDKIRRLILLADSANDQSGISVTDDGQTITVNGEQARFDDRDMLAFRFPRKIQLRPLPRNYTLSREESTNRDLIRGLTVKEPTERVRTDPILTIDGQSFNSLQLRTVVKEVSLRDSFRSIATWTEESVETLKRLIFIDTPGLSVSGGVKDEILRHILANKNRQIIVELLRNDELDFLIHIVLCPNQSSFSELWRSVESQCSIEELADISDRLVLAINGTNRYLTEADLVRKWQNEDVARQEGDHFSVTIEDNILKKMSDHGTVLPARIVFVDCFRHVNTGGRNYEEFYAANRAVMESWVEPGKLSALTMERLGVRREEFLENVSALCHHGDRGQGYLVRQIISLIRSNGPKLYARKYLIRTKLLVSLHQLRESILRSYLPNGKLNAGSIREAVSTVLQGLTLQQPQSIEGFVTKLIDRRGNHS